VDEDGPCHPNLGRFGGYPVDHAAQERKRM